MKKQVLIAAIGMEQQRLKNESKEETKATIRCIPLNNKTRRWCLYGNRKTINAKGVVCESVLTTSASVCSLYLLNADAH
jgi:hypothetical protein